MIGERGVQFVSSDVPQIFLERIVRDRPKGHHSSDEPSTRDFMNRAIFAAGVDVN